MRLVNLFACLLLLSSAIAILPSAANAQLPDTIVQDLQADTPGSVSFQWGDGETLYVNFKITVSAEIYEAGDKVKCWCRVFAIDDSWDVMAKIEVDGTFDGGNGGIELEKPLFSTSVSGDFEVTMAYDIDTEFPNTTEDYHIEAKVSTEIWDDSAQQWTSENTEEYNEFDFFDIKDDGC